MAIKGKIKDNDYFNDRYTDISPEYGVLTLPLWNVSANSSFTVRIEGALFQEDGSFFEKYPDHVTVFVDPSYIAHDQVRDVIQIFIDDHVGECLQSEVPLNADHSFTFKVTFQIRSASQHDEFFIKPRRIHIKYGFSYSYKNGLRTNKFSSDSLDESGSYELDFFAIGGMSNHRTWIGLDPGTTGSCLCLGAYQGNDILSVFGDIPVPSRIIIPQSTQPGLLTNYQPGSDYIYGLKALQLWPSEIDKGSRCFSSIKKLLGYEGSIPVLMKGTRQQYRGVEIAYLLVKGITTEAQQIIDSMSDKERQLYLGPNLLPCERVVVAIPNNYTLPKTLDMVESIRKLDKFREIRCIYEPEAVLFNYLKVAENTISTEHSETVLVFDMGGATINLSAYKISRDVDNDVRISTVGRIGYAVGGDNIDFALLETLLDLYTDACACGILSTDDRMEFEKKYKNELLEAIFSFKLALISAAEGIYTEMFTSESNFVDCLNRMFANFRSGIRLDSDLLQIKMNATGSIWEEYRPELVSWLISSRYLQVYVYDRIVEAVNDILTYCTDQSIDRIIFSGRSVLFPNVKQTVLKALGLSWNVVWDGLKGNEIKTAVAQGACWYGMHGSHFILDNELITSTYGFKLTHDGRETFVPVIKGIDDSGSRNHFHRYKNEFSASVEINSNFDYDRNIVAFYQAMGANVDDIFAEDKRYKCNFIGSVDLSQQSGKTRSVSMSINRQDLVQSEVTMLTSNVLKGSMKSSDRDIFDDNDPAYAFATYQPDQQVAMLDSATDTPFPAATTLPPASDAQQTLDDRNGRKRSSRSRI